MTIRNHLIIFTRFPVPGEAKTRLIPALGAEGAAELQRRMTEHTVAQARKTEAHIEIRYTDGSEDQMSDWLGDDLDYAEQGGGDLGDRMARAFEEHFDADAERVVIVGCDCPSNGWKNIQKSFQGLEEDPCVIGPASDGGYYLIGLHYSPSIRLRRRRRPTCEPQRVGRASLSERAVFIFPVEMFQDIEWGTGRVLKQTLAAAPFTPFLLSELDDVDLPSDIPPKISVIIPTLNEASTILPTLGKVNEGFDVEVIVVDGGSTDGTIRAVQKLSPHLLRCGKGRAKQMNAGAEAATGEILLFLHADTDLPENWDFIIREALGSGQSSHIVGHASRIRERVASYLRKEHKLSGYREACPTIKTQPFVALGAFRFGVKERLPGIGAVEWGTHIRSRVFRMPYGDQGLFLRRDTFNTIGGFPDQPILEDVALVRRARRLGKIVTLDEIARTSGRRWKKRGVVQTTLINQLVLFGAAFGISAQKLRRLYG